MIEVVATRFGVSERHVKQRLRLGKVAPELLDEFRAGKLSLEVMTAFTLGADHATQLAMWRQVRSQSYIQPYTVRRLLTQGAAPLDSRLGEFVGIAAYEAAAGGAVTRDLFSGDEYGFLDDAALVRRLALEKLEEKARELRPHWAWVRPMLDPAYGFTAEYAHIRPQAAEFPPAVAAELQDIEDRLAALEALPEDAWTDGPRLRGRGPAGAPRRAGRDERSRSGLCTGRTGPAPAASSRSARRASSGSTRVLSSARPGLASPAAAPRRTRKMATEPSRAVPAAPCPSPRPPSGEERVRKECGFSQTLVET